MVAWQKGKNSFKNKAGIIRLKVMVVVYPLREKMADDQIQFETLLNTLLNPENEIRTKAEVMYLTYIRLFELKDKMFVSF